MGLEPTTPGLNVAVSLPTKLLEITESIKLYITICLRRASNQQSSASEASDHPLR